MGWGGGGGVAGWGIWFAWCVYMYICIFVYFGIPTFSAFSKTFSILGFWDSHFQRLLKHIFDFVCFYDFWCPGPWEIVGNHWKSWEIVAQARGIVGNRWEIVGNRGNGAQSLIPEQCVISIYYAHTRAPTESLFPHKVRGITYYAHIHKTHT